MEQEKKKLLLVAASVGVFLVIIISAAILIVTPRPSVEEADFSSARAIPAGRIQPASVDPSQLVRNPESIQGIQQAPSAYASQETNFYINGEIPRTAVEVDKSDGDARVVINIPKPSAPAVPDTSAPATATTTPVARETVPTTTPAANAAATPAATPAARTTPAATPAATAPRAATAAVASKPAAASPAPEKTRYDYWVQTGAFRAKVRAETVKETLASKGITSIIDNRVVNGETMYRVRVGPYTTEIEANYWLALIKSIDGFGDSQVRQTVSLR